MKINLKIGTPHVTFNPASYKRAYKNYREGRYRDLIEMMRRTEIDSYVSGCMLGRRSGIMRDWSIIPYDDSDAAQQRANFTEQTIKNIGDRKLLKALQNAVLYGFQVLDFDWEIIDGKMSPITLNTYKPQFFRYDIENDGALKIDFGTSLKPIPADAIVAEAPGTPTLLPVLRDFILKEFGAESWASFIETFGEGLIIGKYPAGASDDDIAALKTAVENLARSSRGIMPDGVEIEFKETNRTTGDHQKFVDMANHGIAIATLGHANAVQDTGGAQIGENITGFKCKREVAVDDLYFIDEKMNEIVKLIESKNFADAKFSRFESDKSEPIDTTERLHTLRQFYDQGGIVDPNDYRKLGIIIQDEQEMLQKSDVTDWGL